jgi:hypothetical protein
MINEEKDNVRIYVINTNTGHIVRSESIITNEALITIAKRYVTKDSIVITLIPNFYCFHIKGKSYFCDGTNDNVIIDFFKDVLSGLYDNARDSFHIQYGRVATICQYTNTVDPSKYDILLTCIDDIWETRYYSRFLRRGKND